MERLFKKALSTPSAQNNFLTKRLNVWVNAGAAWMNMSKWGSCSNDLLNIEDFTSDDCYIGLDLASKIDVASKVYLFKRDSHYSIFTKHYMPRENVESQAHAKSAHFSGWAKEGWITLTEGSMIDLNQIEDELREDMECFNNIRAIGYDPWQATQMAGNLLEEGAPMIEVRPNVPNFSDPMKMIEANVIANNLQHCNDPVLNWMMSNVVCHMDNKDNIYPRKEVVENKIDGVVAFITAMNRALADDGESGISIYETRGITFV